MANLLFTEKALADLSAIWNYTEENWSERQADLYFDKIYKCCLAISLKQKKGKPYIEIGENVWGYLIGQHIIFYRCLNNQLFEITRILHARMDYKRRIKE
ncbi:MAG: type II toxin-antitoxin system RelE/ParE family toxin [Sphingobacteriia bacterium]|nr:MAG: type II toxin-antitoxin system RelE/ParE family toxin [Sphingobacteriia bacterium]